MTILHIFYRTNSIQSLAIKAIAVLCVIWGLVACSNKPLISNERVETPGSLAIVGPIEDEAIAEDNVPVEKPAIAQATPTPVTVPREPVAPLPKKVKPPVTKKEIAKKAIPAKPKKVIKPKVKAQPKTVEKTADASTAKQALPKKKAAQAKAPSEKEISPVKTVEQAVQQVVVPKLTKKPMGRVAGKITVVGGDNKLLSSQGLIVTLTPTDGRVLEQTNRTPARHSVDMRNKEYTPRYMSVNKSDRIRFVNQDKIKHNVFSSTGKNAFDLGTYGAGKSREVALHAEGIVKVYCNIHADMATFIAVDDNSISVVANEGGHFQIEDVEVGDYELRAWHIRGEKRERIRVLADQTIQYTTRLNTEGYQAIEHKNKFGKKYNKNSAIFDDEFY